MMARPAVMRLRLDVVTSCSTTPTTTASVPVKKTGLRPSQSFSGAAVSDPTNSPTLIMDVMTDRLDGEMAYVPSSPRSPKWR